jgi:hypothetical protein
MFPPNKLSSVETTAFVFHSVLMFTDFLDFCLFYYTHRHVLIFFLGALAAIWALAYLHETLRFTSVF